MALSEGFRRGLTSGLQDTRHTMKEKWKGSFDVTSGTHGTLRRVPKGAYIGASGHKAHYEGKIERVFRCDFRDTWHSPKGSEGGFHRGFRTQGTLRRKNRKGLSM